MKTTRFGNKYIQTAGLACGSLIATLITFPKDHFTLIRSAYSILIVLLLRALPAPLFSLQILSILLSAPSTQPIRILSSSLALFLLRRRFPWSFRKGESILLSQLIGFLVSECFEVGFQGWPSFFLLANSFPFLFIRKIDYLIATGMAWIVLSAALTIRQNQIYTLIQGIMMAPQLIYYWVLAIPLILAIPFIPVISGLICGSKNSLRKFYHFSAVILFIPAAMWSTNVLKVAMACAATLFIYIETFRIDLNGAHRGRKNTGPILLALNSFMEKCRNDLDRGDAVLSHIYLLLGCSLPLWLSKDINDSLLLPQLSGVISLGIGDALASIGGKAFGRIKWHPRTNKTVEGSFCAAFGMFASWLILAGSLNSHNISNINNSSSDQFSMRSLFITSIWSSICEALIPLNDNLSLVTLLKQKGAKKFKTC